MATKKKCVSFYLEKDNFDKLFKIVKAKEMTMSRWLSQKFMKIVEAEIKKGESK